MVFSVKIHQNAITKWKRLIKCVNYRNGNNSVILKHFYASEKDYLMLPPRASPVAGLYEVVNEIWDFETGDINMRFGTRNTYCNGLRILKTLGWSGYICVWNSPRGAERGMQWTE